MRNNSRDNAKNNTHGQGNKSKHTFERGAKAQHQPQLKREEMASKEERKTGARSKEERKIGFHSRRDNDGPKRFQQYSPKELHTDGMDEEIENLVLEGRNAVLEALSAEKTIDRILVKKGDLEGSILVITAKARELGIVVQEVAKQKLDELSERGNHQGVIALCPAHEYATIEDMLALAQQKGEDPFLIVLDGIADPHNLGAIIRTAEACGAHGVIIPKRRACGMTATVVKASAGAIAYVPVARITNVTATIDALKKQNIWVFCADAGGQELYEAPLVGPVALVVGGEGTGVSRLVREHCDFVVNIPMKGKIGSLNASVAAAVVMYEVVRRRR